jgi:hypothetical protein
MTVDLIESVRSKGADLRPVGERLRVDRVQLPGAPDEILQGLSDDQRASIKRLTERLAKALNAD